MLKTRHKFKVSFSDSNTFSSRRELGMSYDHSELKIRFFFLTLLILECMIFSTMAPGSHLFIPVPTLVIFGHQSQTPNQIPNRWANASCSENWFTCWLKCRFLISPAWALGLLGYPRQSGTTPLIDSSMP